MTKKPLPSPEDFCLLVSLYDKYGIGTEFAESIYALERFSGSIDSYCVDCKQMSIFHRTNAPQPGVGSPPGGRPAFARPVTTFPVLKLDHQPTQRLSVLEQNAVRVNREFALFFACSRVNAHQMRFYFRICDGKIEKFGQYPSFVELSAPSIEKYNRIIGDGINELKSAIILHTEGFHIGAFTYMRRVFETMINRAENVAKKDVLWKYDIEAKYEQHKHIMPRRIEMLSHFLPSRLVERKSLYGALSDGVHNLSEEDCSRHFAAMKYGIESILDDELEKRRISQQETELSKAIQSVKSTK